VVSGVARDDEGTSTGAEPLSLVNGSTGPAVGERAPDFGAPLVETDGGVAEVTLSVLVEQGPVLLTFCALDAVPAEPARWCAFRDFEWFASGDVVRVVGVSRADVPTHRRFVGDRSLGCPLYADPKSEIADRYGIQYRVPDATTAVRSCFLVDTETEVRYRWVAECRPTSGRAPPLNEMHAVIRREFAPATETFGLV